MYKLKNSPYLILAISVIASFTTSFMGSAINVALPSISLEFSSSAVLLGWIATSYTLANAASLIPVGKLSDIYGRTKFFKAGVLLFALSCLVSGFSVSAEMLLILRAVQGIGLSFIFVNAFSIIVSIYPPKKRGKVLGVLTASIYTGLSTGPFIGGIITQQFGWRYIFYFSFVVSMIVYFMMLFFLNQEWKVAEGEKFDIKGSAVFVTAIISLMLGISFIPNVSGFIAAAFGLGMLLYYKIYSEKAEHPVLELNIFRNNRVFTFSNTAALINYSATAGISFLLSLYLQNIKVMSPQQAGTVLIAQPVLMAFFSPISGRISDRVEPRYVSSAGMLLISVCLGLLCFVTSDTSLVYIILNLAVLGVGFALFSSPNSNAIMSSVEKKDYGTASAILSFMRTTGQMLSMAIVIVILSVLMGKAEIKPENHTQLILSIKIAFALFAFLCFLGIFASLTRGKMHS
ncbi:MAG: MFS transporter [Ignavibacteria bacterium]